MIVWMIILGTGVIALATRISFIYFHGKAKLPSWFHRSLYFVPVAVLAAIVLPGIFVQQGVTNISISNPRLWAAVVAAVVAWKTKNVIATTVVGMGTLWLLQSLL